MTAFLNQDLSAILFPIFFVAIFLFCMGVVMFVRQRKKNRAMIRRIQHGGFMDDERIDLGAQTRKLPHADEKKNPVASFFSFFSTRGRKKDPDRDLDDPGAMRVKFLQAGIRAKNFEAAFFGAKLFLPILFITLFLVIRVFFFPVMGNPMTIFLTVFLGLFGFYLPEIWLKQKTDKRKIALFKALPDAMDLLVVCVEAGMGLDAALLKVGEEVKHTYPDLSREFYYLNLEMRAGKQRQEALKNLGIRTGIDEMNSLVTLLIQTDKFGTSVSKALQVFSDSFRTKRYQMAEEIAAKLPVKILIPLILFIFPALFVVILGPAAITIYQNIILR